MKLKEILSHRSFWSLFIINVAIVAYYLYYNTGFKTLVWIYWFQSAIIGIFTFLNLLTTRSAESDKVLFAKGPPTAGRSELGCMALFFGVHYGMFHFGYFLFLIGITAKMQGFDLRLFEASVGAFFLDQLWTFIQTKQYEKTHPSNPGLAFFLPYLRVVPMHVIIMAPAFLKSFSYLPVFLVLKVIADVITQAIVTRVYGRPVMEDLTTLKMGKT